MKDAYLELYTELNSAVFKATTKIIELERETLEVGNTVHLADLAYVAKESSVLVKGLRVELDKLQSLIAKVFFVVYAADPSTERRVQTEWCTAEPDPKTHASIPRPDTDPVRYAEVMRALGVPEETIATGVMRLSWDMYCEYCTKLAQAGKPIPGACDPRSTYVEHRVSVRARRKLGEQREPGDEPTVDHKGETENDGTVPF